MLESESGKIFISYNHHDKYFVRRLDGDLRSRGLTVFLDEQDIQVGQSIIQRVSEEIEASSYLLVVLSDHSINSVWVQKEISSALMRQLSINKDITILPVLLDNCEVPLLLRDIKWADFRVSYEIGLEQLLRALGASGYTWKKADAEKLMQAGREAVRTGNFDEANSYFEKVLELYGAYPAAFSGLANLRYHQKRYQEGINLATKAINIDPEFPYAYYQRGLCLRACGYIEDARKDFKRAIEIKSDFVYAIQQLNFLDEK